MSGVFTLLSVGTDRVWLGVVLSLVGSGGLEVLLFFILPCGSSYLSLSLGFHLNCGGDRCFSLLFCVSSYFIVDSCLFSHLWIRLEFCFECTSDTSYFSDLSCVLSLYFHIYIIYLSFKLTKQIKTPIYFKKLLLKYQIDKNKLRLN
jgi:hypothetical protein